MREGKKAEAEEKARIAREKAEREAKAEAEAWKKYTAGILQMVYDRTKDLTDDQRKTVYWGNTWGENILASYSVNNRWYEVNLAGGKLLGIRLYPPVSGEQTAHHRHHQRALALPLCGQKGFSGNEGFRPLSGGIPGCRPGDPGRYRCHPR